MDENNKTVKEQIAELEERQRMFFNKLNALSFELEDIKGQIEKLKASSDTAVSKNEIDPIGGSALSENEKEPIKDLSVSDNEKDPIRDSALSENEIEPTRDLAADMPDFEILPPEDPGPYIVMGSNVKTNNNSKDSEVSFGKNFMGIAAAILIFISFILFATLVIPMLSEGMKLGLMYMVSVAFVSVGMVKQKSESKNTFFTSLLAIGVGGIYISLFLTKTYFHLMDQFALYVLLLIWAFFVLWLSRKQHVLFSIIGGLGMLISVIFGSMLCISDKDPHTLMILVIYFIVGSLSYIVINYKYDGELDLNSFFDITSLIVLTVATVALRYEYTLEKASYSFLLIIASVLVVYMLAMTFVCLVRLLKVKKTLPAFWGSLYSAITAVLVMLMINRQEVCASFIAVMALVLFIAVDVVVYKAGLTETENYTLPGLWQVVLILIASFGVMCLPFISIEIGLMIIALPLMCAGFLRSNKMYKYTSLGLVFFNCYVQSMYYKVKLSERSMLYAKPENIIVLSLIFSIIAILFLYRDKKYYDKYFKIALYYIQSMLLAIAIPQMLDKDHAMIDFVVFLSVSAVHIFAVFSPFSKDFEGESEKEFEINSCIINAVLMYMSLTGIGSGRITMGMRCIYILLAVLLFMLNAKKQLEREHDFWNIYVGFKFTLLLWTILGAFDSPAFLVSIAALVLAIVFIIIGFKLKLKALRIYGLVLTMICVVKFVMIDITYSNTLGHALSFFVSGLLCLAVSAIYNYAEKQNR